jgi:hypothetical protein
VLAKVHSCALIGLDGAVVEVEADLNPKSLPSVTLVGLPDAAVKESTERVRAAIVNSGLYYPRGRVTINLAPADLRKEGPAYDLPIAVALLMLAEQIPPDLDGCCSWASCRSTARCATSMACCRWRTWRRSWGTSRVRAAGRCAGGSAGAGHRRLPGGHPGPAGRALPQLPPHRAVPDDLRPGHGPTAVRV